MSAGRLQIAHTSSLCVVLRRHVHAWRVWEPIFAPAEAIGLEMQEGFSEGVWLITKLEEETG